MDLVEVDILRPKPLQALVDLAQDRLARQPFAIWPLTHLAVQLGGNDDLVAIGEVLQSAAENLLALSNRIDVGRVEEIDAKLQRFLDDRPAVPSSSTHLCTQRSASPNPIQPRQIRDTSIPVLPSLAYST